MTLSKDICEYSWEKMFFMSFRMFLPGREEILPELLRILMLLPMKRILPAVSRFISERGIKDSSRV